MGKMARAIVELGMEHDTESDSRFLREVDVGA